MFTTNELAVLAAADAMIDAEDTGNEPIQAKRFRDAPLVKRAKAALRERLGVEGWREYRRLHG